MVFLVGSNNVLVLLGEFSILLLRTDTGNTALDSFLDLFKLVGSYVNVLGGLQKDIAPKIGSL